MRTRVLEVLEAGPHQLADLVAASGVPLLDVRHVVEQLVREGVVTCTRVKPPATLPSLEAGANDRARVLWHLTAHARPTYQPPASPPPAVDRIDAARALRRRSTPHSAEKPEPIEILARMAGRSSFRTPREPGVTAVPVTPLDIAHAIATAPDKLGAAMAMAMACQRPWEFPKVERLGYDRLLRTLRGNRQHPGIVDAPNTYRARIAFHDAFHDLIAGPDVARKRKLGQAARAARMRRGVYIWLLKAAGAFLEACANTAAKDAVRYLFALAAVEHPVARGVRAVSVREGMILVWTSAEPALTPDDIPVDVEDLLDGVLARPRRAGVLTLTTEP